MIVPGNHDWPLQEAVPDWGVSARYGTVAISVAKRRVREAGAELLIDQETTINGIRIYGTPWVPAFNYWAFNLPRGGEALEAVWSEVPPGLDVLVTHGPSHGVLDLTDRGVPVGCELLAARLGLLDERGEGPRLHVHGDIHEAAGVHAPPLGVEGRISVNASVMDGRYRLAHAPTVIDL